MSTTQKPDTPTAASGGDYIVLNGKWLPLEPHPTDFSVLTAASTLPPEIKSKTEEVQPRGDKRTRIKTSDAQHRDAVMAELRGAYVAHHIYLVRETEEELTIDDHIFLTLHHEDPALLTALVQEFHLIDEGEMGGTHVLRVTAATGRNPLKTANEIAQRPEVASCSPQVLIPLERCQLPFIDTHPLFREQWYLSSNLAADAELDATAGIRALEAWQITFGSPEIVIAVMDDGFDLGHPAFRNKRIDPAQRDFAASPQDNNPASGQQDFHGTAVASLATGSQDGDAMVGVAPRCALLPIRIPFDIETEQEQQALLNIFRHVSQHADVVNCSFGTLPERFDRFNVGFRTALAELTRTGGGQMV